jgi:hypothetical protein
VVVSTEICPSSAAKKLRVLHSHQAVVSRTVSLGELVSLS